MTDANSVSDDRQTTLNWLGDMTGSVIREHAERDDRFVVEIHGDEDAAAFEIGPEAMSELLSGLHKADLYGPEEYYDQ